VQLAVPFVFLYLPATQPVQGPPSGPLYPTLHGQSVEPATEFECTGQSRQAELSATFLNFPAAHATQGPPLGPVNAVAHKLQLALPCGDHFPSAHARHVAASVAPVFVENVPGTQSVHNALPLVVLYLPVTQAVQNGLPSGPVAPALHLQAAIAELPFGE
jgi:hypothetical protein